MASAESLTVMPDRVVDSFVPTATLPRFALGACALIAVIYAGLHLLVLDQYGVFRDELYYIACGRHLAWGYVDHPPFVAFLAWIGEHLFGPSYVWLRLFSVVFGCATIFTAAAIARRLGGHAWAQALAAIAITISPHYLYTFHYFSMNSVDVLCWALAAWLVILALQTGARGPWIAFGLVCGIGLLNKHSMLFLGLGLFVGLMLTSARRHLATPWPWVAGLIAALMFLPHVLWQIAHGWPTAEFIRNAQARKIVPIGPLTFIAEQFTLLHPMAALLAIAGIGYFFFARDARPYRLFGWTFATVLVLLLVQRSKPYYLLPVYPFLLAGGAILLERATSRFRLLRPVIIVLVVLTGAATAPLALPILPIERYVAYSRALGIVPTNAEKNALGELPQHYADMFGWQDLANQVAAVYRTLPEPERKTAKIFVQNYGEAGAIDYFGPALGLPSALSQHNNYWYWGPGPDGGTLIAVGGAREDYLEDFEQVEEVARTSCRYCMPYENDRPIFICRGWKRPVNVIWPHERYFI